ncbi:MAG TPA: guanitoxin biosynthesis L-enduracididine beta-hydroxylase GntD [Rugosimonospora sp.]|nr:guanitoxin biosynthesis L-enduracididine beta-hydroxylase GntD [Rugosimonospora sp.]
MTDDEARQVCELSNECVRRFDDVESAAFLREVTVIAHDLPGRIRREVNLARLDESLHALVVRDHAVGDEIGPTPSHWREAANAASMVHSFTLMLYASLFGEAIGWESQQDARVVSDVVPTPGQESSTVSSSSTRELGWHTEDAFSPFRADYVGLFCLRNPDAVATTVGMLAPHALDETTRNLLCEPRYQFLPDPSHDAHRPGEGTGAAGTLSAGPVQLLPILRGGPDGRDLCIDSDYTLPAPGDALAARALAVAHEVIASSLYELVLHAGDVCFLDNRNVVHGRRPFHARFDGQDRWLKRVNVTRDLRRSSGARVGTARRVVRSTP